jgi:putative tryptophan/tyrosine transport system substrate-binding protein
VDYNAGGMTRRCALCVLALAALVVGPPAAPAQPASKVWRIGFFGPPAATEGHLVEAFQDSLRRLGYVEGRNVSIEYRSTNAPADRFAALAAELVGRRVDVLVVSINPAAVAAQRATSTIPIVMVNVAAPVENGLIASLARPGGNITGMSRPVPELIGKCLELTREVVPGASPIGVLVNPSSPLKTTVLANVHAAAASLNLRVRIVEAATPADLDGALATLARERVGAVFVHGDGMFYLNRARLAELVLKHRLPSMFQSPDHVRAGGLMSYSSSSVENYRRAAVYVDRILKGAKPAELPVEQPTTFEMVINLKTAATLGVTVPRSVILRADEVIQ